MIETSKEFIDTMRNIQTVSTRISILNSPEIKNYGYNYSDVDKMLIDNKYIKDNDINLKDIPQMNDCITYETGNYSIFEENGIALDGTIQVPSKYVKNNQYGWYSNYRFIGNIQNDYWQYEEKKYQQLIGSTYAEIAGNVETQSSSLSWKFYCDEINDITIAFSKIRNEYAVSFDIILTTGKENKTINVRNNKKTQYTISKDIIPEFDSDGIELKIIIYRWSKPNARAKINCIYIGQMLEYTDEDIVSFNTTKELDLANESLPSKQIDLTVQDIDSEYNIFKPQGKLSNLNSNSRISLEQGCLIDNFIYYVKTDEYIATKPKKESNSLEVGITGIGRLSSYNDIDYVNNQYEKQKIENILKDEKYCIVDDEIKKQNEEIRTQYGTVSKTEALRKIGLALRANVIEDIDNNIIFKDILSNNEVSSTIELRNMLDNPTIEKIDKPKEVEVKYYLNTTKSKITLVEQTIDILEEPTNYYIKYSKEHSAPPYTATVTYKDGTVKDISNEITFLENRAIWNNAYADEEQEINIKIEGTEIELDSSSAIYSYDNNTSETKTIDDTSIQTISNAKKVFEWLKKGYNKDFKFQVEVQDTFTYELGDIVEIDTNVYVNDEMVTIKAMITKIEQKYNGALHYTLTLRGAYDA